MTRSAAGLLSPDLPGAACKGDRRPLWDDQLDSSAGAVDARGRAKRGEETAARWARHQRAIAICRGCPIRVRCLQDRLADTRRPGGVWGGEVFGEGSELSEAPLPLAPRVASPMRSCVCAGCGRRFTPRTSQHRYCGDGCREADRSSRKAAARREQRRVAGTPEAPTHCQQCQGPLGELQRQRRRRYCSPDCDRAAERDRKRERRRAA